MFACRWDDRVVSGVEHGRRAVLRGEHGDITGGSCRKAECGSSAASMALPARRWEEARHSQSESSAMEWLT